MAAQFDTNKRAKSKDSEPNASRRIYRASLNWVSTEVLDAWVPSCSGGRVEWGCSQS
jgi:hypothetical protein